MTGLDQRFGEGARRVAAGQVEEVAVLQLPHRVQAVHAELERDHLERTGACPDRHRKGDGLEIDETGRRRIGREVGRGARGIEIACTGEGVALDAQLDLVQERVRHIAHVGGTLADALLEGAAGDSRQPAHRILRLGHGGATVHLEAAGMGAVAMSSGPDLRLVPLRRDLSGAGDPGRDLAIASERLRAHVRFDQQATILAVPGVHPGAVDAGQCDPIERDAGRARDEGLDGRILAVVVLDAGSRFDFDHAPSARFRVDRQQDVGEGHGAAGLEAGFEDRLRGGEQAAAACQRRVDAVTHGVEQYPVPVRVVQLARQVAHLVTGRKRRQAGVIVLAQAGTVQFEPEAAFALAEGQQLGLGQAGHGRGLGR